MEPPLWTEGASPWPHEREALAYVRFRLPNHEPYRAWSNVEFIAEDGSVNEVDLIVVSGKGFFLVEIKSWPGTLYGNGQTWRLRRPNGTETLIDHPLILTNRKAKRLRSLLARQPAFRKESPPWVTALTFLSSPQLDCRLQAIARTAVCGRDEYPDDTGIAKHDPMPGIVATLKDPTVAGQRGNVVNKPMSRRINDALGQAGLKPSNRGRRVGDWELDQLLDEGPGWQDFLATRPRMTAKRRARIYLAGATTSADEEKQLRAQADREFRLVQDLRHDGISQPLDLIQAERGPALLFDCFEDEERLDLWAPRNISKQPMDARIELVRQVGEGMAHAHSHRVTHRALTARNILVRSPESDAPRLLIGHWQAGSRELATRLTSHGSTSAGVFGTALTDRLDIGEQVYLAPEAFSVEDPDGVALDTFSLGAIAYLLLSGQSPAVDPTEREEMLARHGGFALATAIDNPPEDLEAFVALATDPVPARRATVRELLDLLDEALDKLTDPVNSAEVAAGEDEETAADPLTAHQGDLLEGGWRVDRRLGSGSTAVALLCTRVGAAEPEVLKVAKDEELAERLLDEARVLETVRHEGIVELLGVERIGGLTALRLTPAGDPDDKAGMTLASRLEAQGRLGLDLLERFGADLLDAVLCLERTGIPHRDIKPENLGVKRGRGDKALHLVLFDFSLARAPDTSLGAGTAGYLDPFLPERQSKRWDPAAERYAAAATLHEMAFGTRPVWGDGRTNPIHLDDEHPQIDSELIDPSVREKLTAFFMKALHRRPNARFDTADAMRVAWRTVFAAATRPTTTSTDDEPDKDGSFLDRLADAATSNTTVAELGLSGAATSALERLGVGTVGQLMKFSQVELHRVPGVGVKVRREIVDAADRLRSRHDLEPADLAASIDRLAGELIPKPTTPRAKADGEPLAMLLGMRSSALPSLPFEEDDLDGSSEVPYWPGSADIKARLSLDRAAYDALLDRARARWAKQPTVTQARRDLAAILERSGGVLSGDDLALALLAQRGSTATGPTRLQRARAVVRAALETEAFRDSSRFTFRRLGGGSSAVVALRNEALEGEELADFAASLGVRADNLAKTDPLLTPAAVLDHLRRVPPPSGLPPISDHRLVRLAAASSATAAASSRLELYPRGMAARRAVRLARAALLGVGVLTEEQVRERVLTRFPRAEPLPIRPELDELLAEAVGLEWFSGGSDPAGIPQPPGYRLPTPSPLLPSTALGPSGSRYRTGTAADVPDDRRVVAENAHDRLERHRGHGGYLVLTVAPRYQQRAISSLVELGATAVSLDAVLIAALRNHAEEKGINWDRAILTADAEGPEGGSWHRLLTVVKDAMPPVRTQLLGGPEHMLLTHPGLLARYQQLGLLDELRECTTRHPEPGQRLRTLWVLIPAEDPSALPAVGIKAVPVTTAAERIALPIEWLENVHRTHPISTGAAS